MTKTIKRTANDFSVSRYGKIWPYAAMIVLNDEESRRLDSGRLSSRERAIAEWTALNSASPWSTSMTITNIGGFEYRTYQFDGEADFKAFKAQWCAIDQDDLTRMWDAESEFGDQPSGVFKLWFTYRDAYGEQLETMLPGRHALSNDPEEGRPCFAYFPDDDAVMIAKLIFDTEDMRLIPRGQKTDLFVNMSVSEEHGLWNVRKGWPWEVK